jgi:hypothetical protein
MVSEMDSGQIAVECRVLLFGPDPSQERCKSMRYLFYSLVFSRIVCPDVFFIGNLSWNTNDEILHQVRSFSAFCVIRCAHAILLLSDSTLYNPTLLNTSRPCSPLAVVSSGS